ncbi:MAG: glycoside hydrolase family 2 TIM barrel-domain containing protein [bacterium]
MRIAAFCIALLAGSAWAAPQVVTTARDEGGWRLLVDGRPTMVFGMNWDYIPIGQNYAWVLWNQPDDVIEEALQGEMALLKSMGINAIRQYPDIPPRWVEWIFDRYGIFTIVNHTAGRYGFQVQGTWVAHTDYADPAMRAAIIADVDAMVARYRGTRGLLMYLLGNENNYGLSWTSFEAENLPTDEVKNGEPLYTLLGELATRIKAADPGHPTALANGDLGYLALIAKHCQAIDIMGSNVYRGASSRDLFDRVAAELDRPFLYSEFGADAYDAKRKREADVEQAGYLRAQWQEIYEQSAGKGKSGVAIGGLIFQWSDGWWKHGQSLRLDEHDTTASWATGAYPHDFVEGEHNMNEEWFGIAAKDRPDVRGVFSVRPRTAYYLLKEAFTLDPYAADTTPERIQAHFARLDPLRFKAPYQADRAEAEATEAARLRVTRLELRLESYFSEGDARTVRGSGVRADPTESVFIDVTARPTSDIQARVGINLLGNVAANRLDRIFYESRGRDLAAVDADGREVSLSGLERVALYQAELEVDQPWFRLEGFYRTGHYHWGDEGDFFGLYREAWYGPNLDTYNGRAPLGAEITGRKGLEGLKLAIGPELYWGANPGFIAKYHRRMGNFDFTLMHQEDLGRDDEAISSLAVPERQSRKTTIGFGWARGGLRLDVGGLMAGTDRVGEQFLWTQETSGRGYRDAGVQVLDDEVAFLDTLGAKARASYQAGRWQGYVHGVVKGLVADAGADPRKRFTGYRLDESGRGNQVAGMAGLAVNVGSVQIAPHVLYQKPLIGPIEPVSDVFSPATGIYYPALQPRNQLDDPFAVLDNRETLGLELLLVYDPTPATWFWEWDNDVREDAGFAASLDLVFRHQPTTRDASFGVTADGVFFAFPVRAAGGSVGGDDAAGGQSDAHVAAGRPCVRRSGAGQRGRRAAGGPLRRRSDRRRRPGDGEAAGRRGRLEALRLPPGLQPDLPVPGLRRCGLRPRRAVAHRGDGAAGDAGHAAHPRRALGRLRRGSRGSRRAGAGVGSRHLPVAQPVRGAMRAMILAGLCGLLTGC